MSGLGDLRLRGVYAGDVAIGVAVSGDRGLKVTRGRRLGSTPGTGCDEVQVPCQGFSHLPSGCAPTGSGGACCEVAKLDGSAAAVTAAEPLL